METVIVILAFFGIVYVSLLQLVLIVIALIFFYLIVIWPITSSIAIEVDRIIKANKAYKQQLRNEQKDKEK